ncbi:hypothetical protein GCM10018793_59970 [Streptomyces sulfonofaciens]|uniref:Uncharacterized protein n=1 Tax=Streptomyces sulfonofaciens TaxID=68272 RepID=A0A919GLK7_9ACTN|nr:hypothetical protein [Streptomyces sulfonofaciens]GHH86768.1 hypothetical protein GCM10018793_59970 [Streptomyces sulfonofaciens]
MDISRKQKHAYTRPVAPGALARGPRQVRGGVRTCIPALRGRGGYQEPAEADPDSHIVRGED